MTKNIIKIKIEQYIKWTSNNEIFSAQFMKTIEINNEDWVDIFAHATFNEQKLPLYSNACIYMMDTKYFKISDEYKIQDKNFVQPYIRNGLVLKM